MAKSRQAAGNVDALIRAQCRDSDKRNQQRSSKTSNKSTGIINSVLNVTDRLGK